VIELIELEEKVMNGELDQVQIGLAWTASQAGRALGCGLGTAETAVNLVLNSIPFISRLSNGINEEFFRDETMDTTLGDLEIDDNYSYRYFSRYDNLEGVNGMWAGGVITGVVEGVLWGLDYGDAEITEEHFNGLRAAYLSTINSARVTMGRASECRQAHRRIRILRGKNTVAELMEMAGQSDLYETVLTRRSHQ